jgi:hypothetical protein
MTQTSTRSNIPSHQVLLLLCLDQKIEANPHARNLVIFDKFISWYKSTFYAGTLPFNSELKPMQEREMKKHMAAFVMMKMEYIKLCGDMSSGIAVLNLRFDRKRQQVSAVILFHNGKVQMINIKNLVTKLSVYSRSCLLRLRARRSQTVSGKKLLIKKRCLELNQRKNLLEKPT